MKKVILSLLSVAALSIPAMAGSEKIIVKEVIVEEPCNFRDFELQLDGFFTGVVAGQSRGAILNSGVGGGVGGNVFFAKYFGLGAEAFWYGNGGTAEHMILGNFFLRYPICSLNLAPYAMVGGGAGWDGTSVGYGHTGIGLEWRFHPNVALFGDGRWFYGAPDNIGVLRSGIRFAF